MRNSGRVLCNLIDRMTTLTRKQLTGLIIASLAVFIVGCGKRGVPIPPRERIQQTVQITGYQQGSKIVLNWKMPARNAEARSLLNIARADVYRLIEPADSFNVLTEEEFADRSEIVSTVNFDSSNFGAKTFTIADEIRFGDRPILVRYAVRLVNGSGQKSGFSNILSIEPSSRVANVAENLSAAASQSAIELSWNSPSTNIDGSSPDNLIGYNIYRKDGKGNFRKMNDSEISELQFEDEAFEFGESYAYFVRAVSSIAGGKSVESIDSVVVDIVPQDTFPPAAPDAVTVAASPNEISIFFASNLENDIAGYVVYRSTDREAALETWIPMNEELLKTNTYRDDRVETGKTYFYFVIAIDTRGNKSVASEIVSDTVPTR